MDSKLSIPCRCMMIMTGSFYDFCKRLIFIEICAILPFAKRFSYKKMNLFGIEPGMEDPKTIFGLRWQGYRIISDQTYQL